MIYYRIYIYNNLLNLSLLSDFIIMMTTNSKFGLRNGTDLLNMLRRKYAKEAEESTLLNNKTFVDDESLELYENGNKEESRIMSQQHSKSKDGPPLEALSEIKPAPTA